MGLCRTCGVRLDAGATACLRCGTPAGEIKVGGDPADVVVDTGHEAAPSDETIESDEVVRRVPWPRVVGLGALGLVLVAALVWVVDLVRDDGSGDRLYAAYVGTLPLDRALTTRPRELWSRDFGNEGQTLVVADRGKTYVSTMDYRSGTGDVRALDLQGEELWRVDLDSSAYARSVSLDGSVLLLASLGFDDEGDNSLVALSTKDGSRLWSAPQGDPFRATDDGVLVIMDRRISLLDVDTGKPRWSVDLTDAWGINDDLVVVGDADAVTAYDLTTGDQAWRLEGDDVPCVVVSSCSVAVAGDLVALASITDAVAVDSVDGRRLWDLELEPRQTIGVAGEDLVYVGALDDNGSGQEGSMTFYDADGRRGEVTVTANGSYVNPVSITLGDTTFINLTWGPSTIYDERFDKVATFAGDLMPIRGGAYVVDDGVLSYVRLDDTAPLWSLDGFNEDGVSLLPDEEGLVVQDGGTVTRYGE